MTIEEVPAYRREVIVLPLGSTEPHGPHLPYGTDKLADNPFGRLRVASLAKVSFVRPWHHYMPASAGGDTRKATAATGEYFITAHAESLAQILVELSQAEYDKRFP